MDVVERSRVSEIEMTSLLSALRVRGGWLDRVSGQENPFLLFRSNDISHCNKLIVADVKSKPQRRELKDGVILQ